MPSAKRSSTDAVPALAAAAGIALGVAAVALAVTQSALALVALLGAIFAAGAVALALVVRERRRHERIDVENERLLAEAKLRESERARLTEQLVNAEQDERRRLALFLHDGPVQNMSGIALMLDAARQAIGEGRAEDAATVLSSALERHRDTIRSLRDLSFNIEPVVLRDQGFEPAVRALADQLAVSNDIAFDVDVGVGETLSEKAQVALYQIIREAVNQAILRGPPKRISVSVREREPDGEVETTIADDGSGERRRRSFEALEERARTLSGRVEIGSGNDGGMVVRVRVPRYAARR